MQTKDPEMGKKAFTLRRFRKVLSEREQYTYLIIRLLLRAYVIEEGKGVGRTNKMKEVRTEACEVYKSQLLEDERKKATDVGPYLRHRWWVWGRPVPLLGRLPTCLCFE